MQVGSLVILENDNWQQLGTAKTKPVKGKIYTVRFLYPYDNGLLLEEIVNEETVCRANNGYRMFAEPGFSIFRFRELQPPMDISIESILESELV